MEDLINDLKFAMATDVCVDLYLTTGEHKLAKVAEVPEDKEWFKIKDPQTFGDDATTRRIFLDQVSSATVTDVR